jgi:hypothetical protein
MLKGKLKVAKVTTIKSSVSGVGYKRLVIWHFLLNPCLAEEFNIVKKSGGSKTGYNPLTFRLGRLAS